MTSYDASWPKPEKLKAPSYITEIARFGVCFCNRKIPEGLINELFTNAAFDLPWKREVGTLNDVTFDLRLFELRRVWGGETCVFIFC